MTEFSDMRERIFYHSISLIIINITHKMMLVGTDKTPQRLLTPWGECLVIPKGLTLFRKRNNMINYIVPVTLSTVTPGVVFHTPFSSEEKAAARTVIFPAAVANSPDECVYSPRSSVTVSSENGIFPWNKILLF